MKLRTMLVAAFASLLPLSVFADDHEEAVNDLLTDVWIFQVEPGDRADFEDGIKAFWAARAEAGDENTWYAYTVVMGKNMDQYMFRHILGDWADMDAYEAEIADYDTGSIYQEQIAPYVDHVSRYFEKSDLANSHWPQGDTGPFYGVTTWYLSEEVVPQAGEARRAVSAMLKDGWASDKNNWMWMYRFGGKQVLQIVTSFSNWADMADPDPTVFDFMMEKMGSEDDVMGMFSDFSAGKTGSDYTVWRSNDGLGLNTSDDD